MKRKYREAMRVAARQAMQPEDDDDQDAAEAMGWHDEWVMWGHEQDMNDNQRSKE